MRPIVPATTEQIPASEPLLCPECRLQIAHKDSKPDMHKQSEGQWLPARRRRQSLAGRVLDDITGNSLGRP
jgi:hypothetical protein